jgi:hypothetical protein
VTAKYSEEEQKHRDELIADIQEALKTLTEDE